MSSIDSKTEPTDLKDIEEEEDLYLDLSKPHLNRDQITKIIGFKPKNLDLYRRAFVHKSLQKNVKYMQSINEPVQDYMLESFERSEYLGDAVLNLVTAEVIFDKYPDRDEGFLTRIRTKIVRGSNCAKLAKVLDLGSYIITGSGTVRIKNSDGTVINDRILEDVFESLICAIYKDLGFIHAQTFIKKLITENIDFDQLANSDDNYKDILMRYTQICGFELPIYKTLSSHGPGHNRNFEVSVSLKRSNAYLQSILFENSENIVHESEYGRGIGLTKKEAEQNACKNAICLNHKASCKLNHIKIHYDEINQIINRFKSQQIII